MSCTYIYHFNVRFKIVFKFQNLTKLIITLSEKLPKSIFREKSFSKITNCIPRKSGDM